MKEAVNDEKNQILEVSRSRKRERDGGSKLAYVCAALPFATMENTIRQHYKEKILIEKDQNLIPKSLETG